MAVAGVLEIQMLANLARLQQDMNQAKSMVGGAMDNIESAVGKAKAALGALGIGLSIGAFAAMVKNSIDAADSLNDLSKSTSLTIAQLSGLKLAAAQSGTDLEGVAKTVNKLSMEMGKNADEFSKIGIKSKDPMVALQQLADVFVSIEDPQLRAAVAAKALGKGWEAAAPLLAEGGAKIAEMTEKGAALSGVTQQMADDADEFNDRMAELSAMTGSVGNRVAKDLLPIMNALAEGLSETSAKSDGLSGSSFPILSESLKVLIVLGGNVAFVLKGIGTEIGGMAAQIAALATGDFKGFAAIGDMMKKDAAEARTAFDAWEKKMMEAGNSATASAEKQAKAVTSGSDAAIKSFVGVGDAAKKSASDYQQAVKASEAYIASLKLETATMSMTEEQKKHLEAVNKAALAPTVALSKSTLAHAAALAIEAARIKEVVAAEKMRIDKTDAYIELLNQREMDESDALKSIEDKIIAINDDTAALVLNGEQLQAHQVQLAMERSGLDATSEEYIKLKQRMEDAYKSNSVAKSAKDAQDAWKKTSDEINRSITDALMRGFESGKGFAQNLVDTIKNMFNTMVLRPIISAIVSPVSGAISAGMGAMGFGGAAQAGTSYVGAASNGMSLYNAGSMLTYDAGIASGMTYGTGFGSQQSMMLAGQEAGMGAGAGSMAAYGGAALGAYYGYQQHGIGGAAVYGTAGYVGGAALAGGMGAAAGGMAAAGTGAMAGATAALAAIPVWGWIALAALAIFGWDSNSVPKIEGNSFGILGDDGNVGIQRTGAAGAAPYGDGDWGRPGADFARIDAMVEPIGKGIGEYIKSMGGDATGIGFALGYNSDPGGTAQDSVMSSVRDKNGKSVYTHNYDVDRGKGAESLQKELPLMMLAAVQAADGLPNIINSIADSVNLLTATAEQADAAIAHINDANTVLGYGKADPLADFNEMSRLSSRSLMDVWNDSKTSLDGLLASYDGSVAATKTLASATQGQYQLELQLIGQIQNALASTQGMFGNSIESIKLSVMDLGGKYDYMRTQADTLYQQLSTAIDPAEIQRLAEQINAYTNQAYGLLDQDQQRGASGEFITYLEKVNELTAEQLNNAQENVIANHDATSLAIATSMDAASARMAEIVAAAVSTAVAAAVAAIPAPVSGTINFTADIPGNAEVSIA